MSGHSQFKNIMYRKGAQDAKRGKVFSKITREIMVAVKEGGVDPEGNTRLRSALINARLENMPKDNIERAIKKAQGATDDTNFYSVRYEGYGPGGVAVIVEGLTDNRNRTAPAVRSVFTKYGGALGETNSVSFQFDHVGCIVFSKDGILEEKIYEEAIEADASDVIITDEYYEVITAMSNFILVRDKLTAIFGDPLEAKIMWRPKNTVAINPDTAKTLLKLIEALEDDDDVQAVFTNHELPEGASL